MAIRAVAGFMAKVRGKSRATPVEGPMPGSIPSTVPKMAPIISQTIFTGVKATEKPCNKFVITSIISPLRQTDH
jgi:hypothetical protein